MSEPFLTARYKRSKVLLLFVLWLSIALSLGSCSLIITDGPSEAWLAAHPARRPLPGHPANWAAGAIAVYIIVAAIKLLRRGLDRRDVLVIDSEGIFYRPVSAQKIHWADITDVGAPRLTAKGVPTVRQIFIYLRNEALDRIVTIPSRRSSMRYFTGAKFQIQTLPLDKSFDEVWSALESARTHRAAR